MAKTKENAGSKAAAKAKRVSAETKKTGAARMRPRLRRCWTPRQCVKAREGSVCTAMEAATERIETALEAQAEVEENCACQPAHRGRGSVRRRSDAHAG